MAENKEIINSNVVETGRIASPDIVDTRKDIELDPKVETWLRRVEKITPANDGIVRDDNTGQPIMTPSAPTNPVIQLPVTKSVFNQGFGKTVSDAGKWLSTFIFRFIKIKVKTKKAVIKFKDESGNN